jgi:hypothetical protein
MRVPARHRDRAALVVSEAHAGPPYHDGDITRPADHGLIGEGPDGREPQGAGGDRADQVLPGRSRAVMNGDDEEVVGQQAAEHAGVPGHQGIEKHLVTAEQDGSVAGAREVHQVPVSCA